MTTEIVNGYDPMNIMDPIEALAWIEWNAKSLDDAKRVAEGVLRKING